MTELDAAHLPPALREAIERRYWAPIGEAAAVERFIDDPALDAAPDRHPALFSDHGVVHVRDIAASAAQLAARLNGVLLPAREGPALGFVQGLAVLMAYVHDIGMVEPTAAGRRVHPQFAAQTVLGAGFDDIADGLWAAVAAALRTRAQVFGADGPRIAREAVALALAHSKSAVPAAILDDRPRLARLMRRAAFTTLAAQQGVPLQADHAPDDLNAVHARYGADAAVAFDWLAAAGGPARAFADDALDAVRVLRAADALRQRGTTLRTSAGYEVCTDRETGEAVVGLRTADQRAALLLRFHNPISSAEANIRATAIDGDGALVVEFWRGAFTREGVREGLLAVTADVIADIEADALASFAAGATRPVRLRAPADDARFAPELAAACAARHPRLAGRLQVLPVAEAMPDLSGLPSWTNGVAAMAFDGAALFDRLAAHGLHVAAIDRAAALAGTRAVRVKAGTVLIESGEVASFVVVPFGPGLVLQPAGGYPPQPLHPWIPLGVTGVVRGGERNAGVVAEQDVTVLLIDGEHYLADWFRPYDLAGLRRWLRG